MLMRIRASRVVVLNCVAESTDVYPRCYMRLQHAARRQDRRPAKGAPASKRLGIVRRASALPIALHTEMSASALLLAPSAGGGWHRRGRRKNNVGDLARMRHHHCVACAGH